MCCFAKQKNIWWIRRVCTKIYRFIQSLINNVLVKFQYQPQYPDLILIK